MCVSLILKIGVVTLRTRELASEASVAYSRCLTSAGSCVGAGGSSTGMKMTMSLAHIAVVDTRARSAPLAAPFRRLLEVGLRWLAS